ncbi:hypothetical protein OAM69_05600 [bacterium]|nr:hypothetical protein [bacterium]
MTYFLPTSDFTKSIVVKKGQIVSLTPGVTASYPDVDERFILNHETNFLGKNTASVVITNQGLLSSANSTTVSGVGQALINLSTSRGALGTESLMPDRPFNLCQVDSTYSFVVSNGDNRTPCGVTINIEKLESVSDIENTVNPALLNDQKSGTGVYYCVNDPCLVRAVALNGLKTESIVLSPAGSETYFLPVTKTFFASNKAELSFTDGVPNKYVQETDGKIVALFKLPAVVISAYFSAAGSVFSSFKDTDSKEAAALVESLKLEIAKQKYTACLDILNDEDSDSKFKELDCP